MIILILENNIKVHLVPTNAPSEYSSASFGADEQGTPSPVGAKEKMKEAQITIQELCSGVSETVSQAYEKIAHGLKSSQPTEVTLKFAVGVGVQGNVIIGGVSGTSTFEIIAKWIS